MKTSELIDVLTKKLNELGDKEVKIHSPHFLDPNEYLITGVKRSVYDCEYNYFIYLDYE